MHKLKHALKVATMMGFSVRVDAPCYMALFMITHTEDVNEYREDGTLRYECTKAFIKPGTERLYDKRIWNNGGAFIRINHATKYKKDGSIEWRLIYNNKGVVIGNERGGLINKNTFVQTRMSL